MSRAFRSRVASDRPSALRGGPVGRAEGLGGDAMPALCRGREECEDHGVQSSPTQAPADAGRERTGTGWGVIVAYALLTAATQMLWLTFAAITTDSAHRYGVSEGAVGWLAEIFPLLYVLLAI